MEKVYPWEQESDIPTVPRNQRTVLATGQAPKYPWEKEPEAEKAPERVPEPNFVERSSGRIQQAGRAMTEDLQGKEMAGFDTSNIDPETMEAFGSPTEPFDQRVAGVIRESSVAAGDILLDGGITFIQKYVPEDWQESIVDFSRETWDKFMSSPKFKEGIQMLGSGVEAYQDWANAYPAYADAIGDAIAVGSWARPGGKKPTTDLVTRQRANRSDWKGENFGEQLGLNAQNYSSGVTPSFKPTVGDRTVNQAGRRKNQSRLNQAKDDLEPIGAERDPTRVRYGARGQKYYDLSSFDEGVAKELVRVPDYSPRRSLVFNMNSARRQALKLKEDLENKITRLGNPAINRSEVQKRLSAVKSSLPNENMLSQPSKEFVNQAFTKINSLINESDGTVLGLLNARREFDNWMKRQGSKLDTDIINAKNVTTRNLRTEMNNIVGDAFDSPFVAESLERQHKLWSAVDRMAPKADKEARTLIGRLIQKAENSTGMKLPTTPLAAGATAGAGAYLLGTPLGAGLAGITGGTTVGVGGIKWLTGPQGQAMMGRALQLAQTTPQLRPTVLALAQMIKDSKEGEGE